MSKKDFTSSDGGGWAELRVEPSKLLYDNRELVVPRTRDDSEDDIPTLPDLDELQEALEKESEAVTAPVVPEQWVRPDSGTYAELEAEEAHVGDISLTALLAHVRAVAGPSPAVEPDAVWTVTSLLNDLHSPA